MKEVLLERVDLRVGVRAAREGLVDVLGDPDWTIIERVSSFNSCVMRKTFCAAFFCAAVGFERSSFISSVIADARHVVFRKVGGVFGRDAHRAHAHADAPELRFQRGDALAPGGVLLHLHRIHPVRAPRGNLSGDGAARKQNRTEKPQGGELKTKAGRRKALQHKG